jgi:hypothetical protein
LALITSSEIAKIARIGISAVQKRYIFKRPPRSNCQLTQTARIAHSALEMNSTLPSALYLSVYSARSFQIAANNARPSKFNERLPALASLRSQKADIGFALHKRDRRRQLNEMGIRSPLRERREDNICTRQRTASDLASQFSWRNQCSRRHAVTWQEDFGAADDQNDPLYRKAPGAQTKPLQRAPATRWDTVTVPLESRFRNRCESRI